MTGSAARTLVIVVVGIALVGGCGRHRPSRETGGGIRQLKRSEMTPAEVKYGIAPIPDWRLSLARAFPALMAAEAESTARSCVPWPRGRT